MDSRICFLFSVCLRENSVQCFLCLNSYSVVESVSSFKKSYTPYFMQLRIALFTSFFPAVGGVIKSVTKINMLLN